MANTHSKTSPTPSVTERHGSSLKAQIGDALYVARDDLAPSEELTAMLKSGRHHLGDAEVPAILRECNAGRAQRRPR
jgi:hypothetical protein